MRPAPELRPDWSEHMPERSMFGSEQTERRHCCKLPAMTSAAREFDSLSLDQFETELRRFTHSRPVIPVTEPLDRALKLIEQNPALGRSRLLVRILSGLSGAHAEFRSAEVASFDSATISIVMQLMEARRSGATAQQDWLQAAKKAHACQDAA
jgi:hypothetical protein